MSYKLYGDEQQKLIAKLTKVFLLLRYATDCGNNKLN